MCKPFQLSMPDLRGEEEASQDRCALRPQLLGTLFRCAAVGGSVEASQQILIGTHGGGTSRQRRGASAAQQDSDEPPLVQSLLLVMEATEVVDARKEIPQGALDVFAGRLNSSVESLSSVDDLA